MFIAKRVLKKFQIAKQLKIKEEIVEKKVESHFETQTKFKVFKAFKWYIKSDSCKMDKLQREFKVHKLAHKVFLGLKKSMKLGRVYSDIAKKRIYNLKKAHLAIWIYAKEKQQSLEKIQIALAKFKKT